MGQGPAAEVSSIISKSGSLRTTRAAKTRFLSLLKAQSTPATRVGMAGIFSNTSFEANSFCSSMACL